MGILLLVLLLVGAPILVGVVVAMENSRQRQQAESELRKLLDRLRHNPGDLDAAFALQGAISQPEFGKLTTSHSSLAYNAALDCLEHNPASVKAKTIALTIGRWHHARCREEEATTIFDESAMQNDILVRCQMLPEAAKQEVG